MTTSFDGGDETMLSGFVSDHLILKLTQIPEINFPGNANFVEKLEKVQYNACLAITGCFRGTSREKLFRELGLESLAGRRFSRRLLFFYKIVNGLAPSYLSYILPPQREDEEEGEGEERRREIPPFRMPFCRTERYRSSFFSILYSRVEQARSKFT